MFPAVWLLTQDAAAESPLCENILMDDALDSTDVNSVQIIYASEERLAQVSMGIYRNIQLCFKQECIW